MFDAIIYAFDVFIDYATDVLDDFYTWGLLTIITSAVLVVVTLLGLVGLDVPYLSQVAMLVLLLMVVALMSAAFQHDLLGLGFITVVTFIAGLVGPDMPRYPGLHAPGIWLVLSTAAIAYFAYTWHEMHNSENDIGDRALRLTLGIVFTASMATIWVFQFANTAVVTTLIASAIAAMWTWALWEPFVLFPGLTSHQ